MILWLFWFCAMFADSSFSALNMLIRVDSLRSVGIQSGKGVRNILALGIDHSIGAASRCYLYCHSRFLLLWHCVEYFGTYIVVC